MRIGRAAALTDTGRGRLDNEDAFVLEPPLFAVADGMGGAQAGEVASRLAAGAFREDGMPSPRAGGAARGVIQEANRRIYERRRPTGGHGDGDDGHGRAAHRRRVTIGHVGDSRAYRLRGGRLEQLTKDHSLVDELVRSGRLTEEEADAHPQRSVITRALGTDPRWTSTRSLEAGSRRRLPPLLGRPHDDGPGRGIAGTVAAAASVDETVRELVRGANRGGGEDNITVVAFEVLEGDPPERPAPAPRPEPQVPEDEPHEDEPAGEDAPASEPAAGVRRHGAGDGSRWPALLLLAAVLLVAGLALWWGLTR